MFIRHTVSRISSSHNASIAIRSLSSQGEVAVTKLRCALEEYRQEHYSQELRSRFNKDIVLAAKQKESNTVGLSGMLRVLTNINMQDKISEQEMKMIFSEMGGSSGMIPADRMVKML